MTRTMGDAIHANVAALETAGVQLVAGYVTGSPDIAWSPADWARFPGLPQVHIDQGYNSTPATEAHAIVFDIETGAWAPSDAARLISANTTPRPTIYVNRSNLDATVASARQSPNWRGDVWLAYPGWQPGQPLPPLPAGCRYVAVQNQLDVAGLYDLSAVLDPTWPEVPAMTYPQFAPGYRTCWKCCAVYLQAAPSDFGSVCPAGGTHSSGIGGTADTIAVIVDGTTAAGQ